MKTDIRCVYLVTVLKDTKVSFSYMLILTKYQLCKDQQSEQFLTEDWEILHQKLQSLCSVVITPAQYFGHFQNELCGVRGATHKILLERSAKPCFFLWILNSPFKGYELVWPLYSHFLHFPAPPDARSSPYNTSIHFQCSPKLPNRFFPKSHSTDCI